MLIQTEQLTYTVTMIPEEGFGGVGLAGLASF